MRVLVTGAAGFVGRYVGRALQAAGHEALLVDRCADIDSGIDPMDITSTEEVQNVIGKLRPNACIHLAAISFVPDAAQAHEMLAAVNVDGAVNVARAMAAQTPGATFLFVSTAQVYGYAPEGEQPLSESAPLRPISAYAASKARAESELQKLAKADDLRLIIARPGNHTGPGQSEKFVIPSFMRAVRNFQNGATESIKVGNLASERDFTDVRDVVAAYLALIHKGASGGIYNISSGQHFKIGDLLQLITSLAMVAPKIEIDRNLFRLTDKAPRLDTCHLRDLGWRHQHSVIETVSAMWHDCN